MQMSHVRAHIARMLAPVCASLGAFLAATATANAADLGRYGLKDTVAHAEVHRSDLLTIEAGLGRLEGTAREIVYDSPTGRKVSELFWDMDNTTMFNAKLSLRVVDWFRLRTSGSFALSGDAVMDDYDWIFPGPSGLADWSHWSNHPDTDLKHAHMLDLGGELRLLNHSGFQLFGLGGYKWTRYNWDAKGGTFIYSNNAFRDNAGSFNSGELGISYTQDYGTPYIGVGAGIDYGRFSARGSVIASHIVKASGKDTHHLRDLLFIDEFDHGRFVQADAEVAFQVNDRLAIVGGYQYVNFDEVRGTSKVVNQNIGNVQTGFGPQASGAELETQMWSLGVRYALH